MANIAVSAQATFAAHRQLGALRHALCYGVEHVLGCGPISSLEDHDACLAEGFARPRELRKYLGAYSDIGVLIDVAIQQHEVEQRRLVVDKDTSSRGNVMLASDENVRASNCQCPIAVQSMDGPCGGWAVLRPNSKVTAIHKGLQREVAKEEVSAARRFGQNLDRHGGTPKTHPDLGWSATIVRVDIDFAKNAVGSQCVRTAALWYGQQVAVGASAPGLEQRFPAWPHRGCFIHADRRTSCWSITRRFSNA